MYILDGCVNKGQFLTGSRAYRVDNGLLLVGMDR